MKTMNDIMKTMNDIMKTMSRRKTSLSLIAIEFLLLPPWHHFSKKGGIYRVTFLKINCNQLQSIFADGLLSISKTIEMHAEGPLYKVVLMSVNVYLMSVNVYLMSVNVYNVANKVVMDVDNCKAP